MGSNDNTLATGVIRYTPNVITRDKTIAPHTQMLVVTSLIQKDSVCRGKLKTLNNCAITNV